MERLYQIISRHFSQSEISNLAADLGIYVPSNADPRSMARELFSGAKRNLRLDILFYEVHSRRPGLLDLGPNLYELIAGTFNETEAAELTRNLGFDSLNVGLDANGLIGWNNDDFFKNRKAQTIQETALKQNKYTALLAAMKQIRPALDLTVFEQSVLRDIDSQRSGTSSQSGQPASINPANLQPQIVQYIQHIYGDNVLGDKIAGDKAGGNITKDVSVSGASKSAISVGGDATANIQAKNVEERVTVENRSSPFQAALMVLLDQINGELAAIKSELDPADAEDIIDNLDEVKEELLKEQPNGKRVTRKLDYITVIVQDSGIDPATGNQLGSRIEQAIQIANIFNGE